MNIDFLTALNKTSGTPFNPSGQFGAAAPGFREQLNRAIRDDGRKEESPLEKKTAGQKKPVAAGQSRDSAQVDGKTPAPEKNDRPGLKRTDNKTVDAQASGRAEETPETSGAKFAQAGDDSGFYGELEEAVTSETENAYMFMPPTAEAPAPEEFADFSISSSADGQVFPADMNEDDSGLAGMMDMKEAVENTAVSAGLHASNGVAVTEVISQMITDRIIVASQPEKADVNIPQNVPLSGSGAANEVKELSETMDDPVESANAESARPAAKDVLERELFQQNPAAAQNNDRNTGVLRNSETRNEPLPETKASASAELSETLKQSTVRASLEEEAALLERMAAQTARPRENATFAKTSEPAVKTVQGAEASVQVTSGTGKAEAATQARGMNAPDPKFVFELAGRIHSQIQGGREVIRIQLQPEHLGRLEIRAESGRNGIIARIAAESMDVKRLLESNLQTLQQTLETRGLKIDRLHIIVEENSAYAAFADGGRYGHAGAGPRSSEISEFSKGNGTGIESPQDEDIPDDLSAAAEQRGVGFYQIG